MIKKIDLGSLTIQQQYNQRENREPELYYRVIKEKSEVYDIIQIVFDRYLNYYWKELPHGVDLTHSWNLMWSWSKIKSSIENLLVW